MPRYLSRPPFVQVTTGSRGDQLFSRGSISSCCRSVAAGLALLLTLLPPPPFLASGAHHALAQAPGGESPEQIPDLPGEQGTTPGTTEINLKNAEISSIIRIFSKKTGRNYILDENVKGKVSIYLPGKVSENEALRILDSILALKGFTAVPIGTNLWKIIPSKEAKQTTIPFRGADDEGDRAVTSSVVTRLVPLKYTNADDVKQLITPLVSSDGLITAYTGTNSLIIVDSEDNISRIQKIINEIDIASSDRDMTIIPVKNAAAADIAAKLNEILGAPAAGKGAQEGGLDLLRSRGEEQAAAQPRNAAAQQGGQQAQPQNIALSSRTITARSKEPKITADERTNSIIVVADEDTTARIRALVSQLDSALDLSGNRFYVYRCQHASADELAQVLTGLAGGGGATGGGLGAGGNRQGARGGSVFGGNDDGTGTGGGLNSNRRSGVGGSIGRGNTNPNRSGNRTLGRSRNENQGPRQISAVTLGEDISITADPATNSLVIFSSKADYEKILSLLKELDIKRRQVLVEAVLLEVGIDDTARAGFSFLGSTGGVDGGVLIRNEGGDLTNLIANPQSIQNFSIAAASAGTLTLPGGIKIPTQAAVLTAARRNTNVNILSSPTILTTDNEEAEIVVGQNIPFISSTSTNDVNLNNTFNQVDRQDVGITLRLTPQISSGEFVTLKIFTEVSNVIPDTVNSALGPTTTVRTSDTTVITKDSQMIVTGGLISDDVADTVDGIPFLRDIPVFGHFFKQSGDRHRRNNLLILITPRIIKDQYDHRDVTVEQRDRIATELKTQESQPTRDEVLFNQNINKVGESRLWEGKKPGTITAPAELRSSVQMDKQAKSSGVLDLTVRPNLPTAGGSETTAPVAGSGAAAPSIAARASSPQPQLPPSAPAPSAALTGGSRYVVLKLGAQSDLRGVPFGSLAKNGVVGIIIPDESAAAAKRYFLAGSTYKYAIQDREIPVQVMGVYGSITEAAKLDPRVPPGWYTLSPYEIMNLGSGPWKE